MNKEKQKNSNGLPSKSPAQKNAKGSIGNSVYARKKKEERNRGKLAHSGRGEKDEFDQQIIDIARVTRVMAGGKRMRFRACVVLGNKKGKVAVGLAKGADVPIAVNKAVNKAKKEIIDIPIINDTIPHEIFQKKGSAKVLLKPARKGKGIIAGGAVRIILELSGIKNITSKNLGTNNKINVASCTIKALSNLKKIEARENSKKSGKTEPEKSGSQDLDSNKANKKKENNK